MAVRTETQGIGAYLATNESNFQNSKLEKSSVLFKYLKNPATVLIDAANLIDSKLPVINEGAQEAVEALQWVEDKCKEGGIAKAPRYTIEGKFNRFLGNHFFPKLTTTARLIETLTK